VEIVFSKQQEEVPNEEGSFVLARALEEGRVVDVNQALMTERHHDISHIHSEMQQLNAIQRGSLKRCVLCASTCGWYNQVTHSHGRLTTAYRARRDG
jgi:uncharacterized Fe-S radical SAM superfamily protein PflX